MPLFAFEGRAPRIDPTAFVAPTATLIGDVTVEAGASVWFNAVLRGDYGPIVVREGANVQDGSVLHAPPGIPVDIGPGATVAHMCLIHGVHVGSEALIANHATVLDGAVIGARSLIAAHSLVLRSRARSRGPVRRCGSTSTRRPTANWRSATSPGWSRSRRLARRL
jgi:carbonic anhydrase/acetyltransferase-like protein (isoleucine patch superfamily)